jgi:ribosomal protein L32
MSLVLFKYGHRTHTIKRRHINGAQSSRNTKNRKRGHHITPNYVINNDILKSTSDIACSINDRFHEKIMLPEDSPV